jgi:hypothetical protein
MALRDLKSCSTFPQAGDFVINCRTGVRLGQVITTKHMKDTKDFPLLHPPPRGAGEETGGGYFVLFVTFVVRWHRYSVGLLERSSP